MSIDPKFVELTADASFFKYFFEILVRRRFRGSYEYAFYVVLCCHEDIIMDTSIERL